MEGPNPMTDHNGLKAGEWHVLDDLIPAKAIREQRRYEIAKECVARLMTNERMLVVSAQYRAETAVAQADALLAELEKKP